MRGWLLASIVAVASLQAPSALAAPGDLDPAFDGDGKVTTAFDSGSAEASAMAVQGDGKIVVVGASNGFDDFALARYNEDGSLDTDFGTGGKVETDLGAADQARAVVVQADGEIVLGGTTCTISDCDFALARYNENGNLDPGFGNAGVVTSDPGQNEQIQDMLLQPGGKLVVGGVMLNGSAEYDFALARYSDQGTLDTTFGSSGIAVTDLGSNETILDLDVQSTGMLVAAGPTAFDTPASDFAVARYTEDGVLDQDFGTAGTVTQDFGAWDEARAIAVQNDDRIVAAGFAEQDTGGPYQVDFALLGLDAEGAPDGGFGSTGLVTTDLGMGVVGAAAVQGNGKIVVGGADDTGLFGMARYNPDGSLDNGFSADGVTSTGFGGTASHQVRELAIQPDGKILAAGKGGSNEFHVARYLGDPPVGVSPSIAAGLYHSCALKSDRSVTCWGYNANGQTTPPAGTFTSITAGAFSTCAIKSDESIACWGNDSFGQSSPPGGNFSALSAGAYHTCAIRTDQSLACWGLNNYGQANPPSGNFTSLASGGGHSCAIRTDQSLACWGLNDNGQANPPAGNFTALGAGGFHSCAVRDDQSLACWGLNNIGQSSPPAGAFTSLTGGYLHTCALKTDQSAACWGFDGFGQATPPPGSFTAVAAGGFHSCAIRPDESIACWGYDSNGQSTPPTNDTDPPETTIESGPSGLTSDQTPTFTFSSEPGATFECSIDTGVEDFGPCSGPGDTHTPAADLPDGSYTFRVRATDAAQNTDQSPATRSFSVGVSPSIAAGLYHSCALKSDRSVTCWGYNANGQTTPPAGTFTSITAGAFSTCAIKSDESIACWGNDSFGQSSPPGGNFSALSAGAYHTCAIRTDQSLACWGLNNYGQANPPSGNFTSLASGGGHSCAIRTDQSLACWGLNDNGQANPPAGNFTALGAGGFHSCAVRDDQSLACWGLNNIGQSSPPAGAFTSLTGGYLHTCALKTDQSAACWGFDGFGQATPPPGSFTAVAAGGFHSCAIRPDESIACWGYDSNGQSTPPTNDTDPPETTIESGPSGLTSDQTPTFTFSSEPGATFECSIDTGVEDFGPCSGPGDTHTPAADLPDGSYTFRVRATDAAQNTDQSPATRSFTVDTQAPGPPNLSGTSPASPANDNGPGIHGSAEADSTVEIYTTSDCSGPPLGSGSAAQLSGAGITVSVPDDSATSFRATATDGAGNTSPCSDPLSYTEDSTDPETTIDSGPSGPTNDQTPSFEFHSEAGSSFECRVDTDPFGPCSGPGAAHTTANLTDGPHSFEVRATDTANNTDPTPASRSFTVVTSQGHAYWSNLGTNTIGSADLDGSGVNQGFITGASNPFGVVVSADYVYWTNAGTFGTGEGTIGRADLDGSNVNQSFISGASDPRGVAVDAEHVYWTNKTGTIGRANLDGSGVDHDFIGGASVPLGVAVDAGHIYWANWGTGMIGRANLDGSGANQSFIPSTVDLPPGPGPGPVICAGGPTDVAVDAGHIYWSNGCLGVTIGRANLDGSGVNQSFISGASGPKGVDVDAGHVYWANAGTNTIGRANLDGSNVNQSFIIGAGNPWGLDSAPASP